MTRILLLAALLSLLPAGAGAKPADEAPPTVPTSDLIPPDVLNGEGYTIDPQTATDGFMGIFQLHTQYGDYQCTGSEMLYLRIYESRALAAIDKGAKTKAFMVSTGSAALEPAAAAVKIVTHPVNSLSHIPVGVGHLFMEIVGGAADAGAGVAHLAKHDSSTPGASKPPPSRDDPIGYNAARSEWARRYGVDPYTTNRVLALKLNHLGTISFGTDKIVGAGVGFGMGFFGTIADWLSYLPDVDEHLMTAPPSDVDAADTRRLEKLGVPKRSIKPLIDNPWFSPVLQIRYVDALARLDGVTGLASATELAGSAQSEEQARFLCGSLEMLDRHHKNVRPFTALRTYQGLPAAVTNDGALVIAAPIDLLSWTSVVDQFASRRDPAMPTYLYVAGALTPRAQEGFAGLGWKICALPPSTLH